MSLPMLYEAPGVYLSFASLHLFAGHFGSAILHRLRFGRTPLVLYRAPRAELHTRVTKGVTLLAIVWAVLLASVALSSRTRNLLTLWGYVQLPLWVGWLIACMGLVAMLMSQWNMGPEFRIGQSPNDAPKALRTEGVYRYSRNPIYLGSWTMLAGMTAWYPHLLAVAVLFAIGFSMHLLVRAEERFLLEYFASVYEEYCARTPRYLGVPR
jgi:protein-S-isoprenylcysteine O-methyltransferase Ste14